MPESGIGCLDSEISFISARIRVRLSSWRAHRSSQCTYRTVNAGPWVQRCRSRHSQFERDWHGSNECEKIIL